MNTLTINSKAALTLARATEKSKKLKPRVRKTSTYGVYQVESSDKSRWYTVTCNSVTKEITCNCKATHPCYHCSTIAPIHVYIARQRRDQAAQALAEAEAEAANWPVPVEQSEVPSFDNEVAPAGLVVQGVITTSMQELNDLIEQAIEKSDEQANMIAQAERDYPDLLAPIIEAADQYQAAKQAEREELAANPRKCAYLGCTVSAHAGCDGYCQDCYNGLKEAKEHEDIFGFAPVRRERVKEEW